MGRGPTWSKEDLQLIRDNPYMPVRLIAEKLGRTESSITHVRRRQGISRQREKRPQSDLPEYDMRPNGWYDESIGQMLIDYKPAYKAWLHYHSYVEVKIAGRCDSALGGYVFLKCRRDTRAA